MALVLTFVLVFSLCGCGEVVSDIAGNVADAAAKELEAQGDRPFTVVSSGHVSDRFEDQVEELNAKLMPKDDEGNLRHSRRMAARIIFSEMLQVDFSDGEPLRIPHSLASFIRMEEWTLPLGILSEDNGKVLLRESGFEF